LDFTKFLGFGSNRASMMVRSRIGVATQLKNKVNPHLIVVHCIAHRTNLAFLEATKGNGCSLLSNEVDNLINLVVAHFKKFAKRKSSLQTLQNELFDSQKTLKRFHKIRWLSRWQAIIALCDSLESVLVYFHDTLASKDDGTSPILFNKLRSFKMIYVLHFLVDILYTLSLFCRIFQYKFVDVSCIGSLIKTEIAQIQMLFVDNSIDLNAATFNESTSFHILLDFGPLGGYMRRLQSEIRRWMYHGVQISRDSRDNTGADLKASISFQKCYA